MIRKDHTSKLLNKNHLDKIFFKCNWSETASASSAVMRPLRIPNKTGKRGNFSYSGCFFLLWFAETFLYLFEDRKLTKRMQPFIRKDKYEHINPRRLAPTPASLRISAALAASTAARRATTPTSTVLPASTALATRITTAVAGMRRV